MFAGPEDAMWCGVDGKKRLVQARERGRRGMIIQILREFAAAVGLLSGADGDVKDGVTFDEKGGIIKIEWANKGLNGDLDKFEDLRGRLPKLEVLDLEGSADLDGDVAKLRLPEGIKEIHFKECGKFTGDVGKLVLPEGMQSVSFAGCGLTGDITHIHLPMGIQDLNLSGYYHSHKFTGDVTQLKLPEGMQTLNFTGCYDYGSKSGITGAVDKLLLPEGMQGVNFESCGGLAGDLTQLHLPVGMKDLNLRHTMVTGKATSE